MRGGAHWQHSLIRSLPSVKSQTHHCELRRRVWDHGLVFIAEHNSVDAGASSTIHIVAIHDHIARADADTDISIKTALTVQIYSMRSPSTSLAYIRPHITKTLPLAYSLVSRVLSVPFFSLSLSSSTHYSHEQMRTNQSRFPQAGPACESVTVKTADRGS